MAIPNFLSQAEIPHKPGIYIYKDSNGKVIYVGKAVDLKTRVSSYFNSQWKGVKTAALVENITDIETVVVESELEALILEANLIKKFLPTFNIRLTDDKDYLYIVITDEEFPKVLTGRKKDLRPVKAWFGPYPSSKTVKETLKKLRRVFPWCQLGGKRGRACFYYHIGLCPGACVGEIMKEDYNLIIKRFIKFMEGKKQQLLEELYSQMDDYSQTQQYEEASKIKKIIAGIEYIAQPTGITKYLENPNFLEDMNHQGLEELQKDLNLKEFPERIECYDISNFQGKEATGSMVVLTNGEIDKSQYRRFKIKITGKPNDVGMHKEMMGRRLKHPEWPYPQLFLIDGGRGQVKGVREEIFNYQLPVSKGSIAISNDSERSQGLKQNLQIPRSTRNDIIKIPIFGLAKRMEWLYPPTGEIIKLPKKSLGLRLLQKIRDESHRFAITYHRKLRAKAFLPKK